MLVKVNKNSLVVQSNGLVEAKYRLSVEEQKIIRILISQIQKDDEDFKDYEFRIKELAELLGMDHKNTYGVLRGITKKLVSKVLEFYDSEKKEFIQASWLSGARYKEGYGTVILHFDPLLKPLLLQLQSYFTKYELGRVLQFKGQYTIRFFELRKSFLGRNKPEVAFKLEELREILGLKKDEYKEFFNFKARVLEPARAELLEKAEKSFAWAAVRTGRGGKVIGVQFIFDGDNKIITDEKGVDNKKVSMGLLVSCGISLLVAEELAEKYEEAYIREKIAIADLQVNGVKNKAGYIIKAIQENWYDADIVRIQEEERQKKVEKGKEDRRNRVRSIVEAYNAFRKTFGFEQYRNLPDDEKHRLRCEFLANLDNFFKPRYEGKESFGFEDSYFRSFVMERLKIPTFDGYVVDQGIILDKEDHEILRSEKLH